MIRLDETHFEAMYKIMVEAFPIEERRDKEKQRSLFRNPAYDVYGCVEKGKLCAFITIWKMKSAHFVEHLAVDHTMRGTGVGNRLLKEYMYATKLPIVLEVEKPENELARRRIGFYERIGFQLYDDISYSQPAFHKGLEDLPLYIMCNPMQEREQILTIIKEVYRSVYNRVF